MEKCFSFDWQAIWKPTLTDTKRRTITLQLDKLVPDIQQKNGSVTPVNMSAVTALPGEPKLSRTHPRPSDIAARRGEPCFGNS